ncbi:SDR family oxidoreductase [Opitutia bacterium ISCC 51]|nr:2-keto-3-deoxy-L-fuconate dehydrogenase [Verrucomicrobiota bacterium]QXD22419.1 SDR family oxidoreductase [Opitutae bacterium ISCC 51]QXD26500.1 SDR family oxidoreductase [Opitutae bacterium ISCC 52]
MDLKLKDKKAFVTGAGSGIGQAISLRFGEEGAEVFVLDVNEAGGQETVSLITDAGGTASYHHLDVTDAEAVTSLFLALGPADILVNNAGIASIGNVEATSSEEMDKIYAVNIKGPYNCLHAAMPGMKANGGGAVLNLASIASKIGISDRFAYSASKGAVFAMTLSVAKDYLKDGIRSNCLCPGRVHTAFVDSYLDKNYPDNREEMFEKLSTFQPIGRMGRPEEIGALAVFLCSDEASFITGSAYDIDGGSTLLR